MRTRSIPRRSVLRLVLPSSCQRHQAHIRVGRLPSPLTPFAFSHLPALIAATHPSLLMATNVILAPTPPAPLTLEFFTFESWSSLLHPPSRRPTLLCALHAHVQAPEAIHYAEVAWDVTARLPSAPTLMTRHATPGQSTVVTGTDTVGKRSMARFDKHMCQCIHGGCTDFRNKATTHALSIILSLSLLSPPCFLHS